jgi:hypothetical protein
MTESAPSFASPLSSFLSPFPSSTPTSDSDSKATLQEGTTNLCCRLGTGQEVEGKQQEEEEEDQKAIREAMKVTGMVRELLNFYKRH